MKTTIAALLFALIVTNTIWFCSYDDLSADYAQEQGLRDESDHLLRECRGNAKANDEAATECAERTGYKFNCQDGTQSSTCF